MLLRWSQKYEFRQKVENSPRRTKYPVSDTIVSHQFAPHNLHYFLVQQDRNRLDILNAAACEIYTTVVILETLNSIPYRNNLELTLQEISLAMIQYCFSTKSYYFST